MWRAWLEKAYTNIEIWDCWTEVPVRYGIPDALAWGRHGGRETLFWLEVDSGHSSRRTMEANYRRRLQLAYTHAAEWRIPIVFCIMGSPWVVDAFRWCIPPISGRVAVIGHDWCDFGNLPMYQPGEWREDLKSSRHLRTKKLAANFHLTQNNIHPSRRRRLQNTVNQNPQNPGTSKDHPMMILFGSGDGPRGRSDVLMKVAQRGCTRL